MGHRVISLKYRPQDFDELTGQEHIIFSLKGAINSGAIGHAFLFAGPRGVGKTTMARIFAKSLNCLKGPTIHPCQECQSCKEITATRSVDVIEIDGASNRGIDEIRNLREGIKYSPLHSRYKVYIIDEVHMLTPEAFNALLKTLEEPPANVVFILATTNPAKVPATILSRCQRFIFKRLSISEITKRLKEIAEKEGIKITERALYYLALRADGSIRDGESILEQLSSFVEGEITEEDVFKMIGLLANDFYLDLLKKIAQNDLRGMIEELNRAVENGADPLEIYRGLVGFLRKTMLIHIGLKKDFIECSDEEIELLRSIGIDLSSIINMLETSLKFEDTVKRSINPRIALELLFTQLISNPPTEINSQGSKEANPLSREGLVANISQRSPRLAAIVHQVEVVQEKDTIILNVKNEFQKKELLKHQSLLEEIIHKSTGRKYTINIQLLESPAKDNGIVKTIKRMFDGEEVR